MPHFRPQRPPPPPAARAAAQGPAERPVYTPPLVESARPIYDRLCAVLGERSNTYEFVLWAKLMVTPHLDLPLEARKRATLADMERKLREAEAAKEEEGAKEVPG